MNTIPNFVRKTVRSLLLALATLVPAAYADIPAPDNIFYGTITINGSLITAASNQVSIEARREPTGAPIAIYRMGSEVVATNFYVLRLPLEEFPEVKSTNASLVGATIYLVVKVGDLDNPLIAVTNLARGVATRLNFGLAPVVNDNDGLPDDWENLYFGNTSHGPNDLAANGLTLMRNFIEGNDPDSTNGMFRLTIGQSNSVTEVSFYARKAEGVGYSGYVRRYNLQSRSNLNGAAWSTLTNYHDLVGSNQTVRFSTAGTNVSFFRGQVYLETP